MQTSILLLVLMLFSAGSPLLHAEEYGRIRPLNERAADVVRQRNDFVAQVLNSYAVPYERNERGVVVRIKTEGRWLEVTSIEIVPLLVGETGERARKVAAHQLLFYTADGTILDLFSELIIH